MGAINPPSVLKSMALYHEELCCGEVVKAIWNLNLILIESLHNTVKKILWKSIFNFFGVYEYTAS